MNTDVHSRTEDRTERSAEVIHVPEGDCQPVVLELSDEFGSIREVYLDYETAGSLCDQLTEISLSKLDNGGTESDGDSIEDQLAKLGYL